MSYNGYPNYESWAVALWLDNDEGTQSLVMEMAREAIEGAEATQFLTHEQRARFDLADRLKDWVEENSPAESAECRQVWGMYWDLLNAALSEVRWDHIARHYIDAVKEEAEA